ncbi:MAG: tetratricopeptide repeat protein, partial [Acidobacteriia bacterium]|nr:tetratricopeptide repeat protein [Terriglobia bacterium]
MQLTETDIAIIAPTGIEWLGVLEQISNAAPVDDVPLPMKAGTIGRHSVLCCASGKGQEETASAATLVLERAKPFWVFLVGIAGGFPQQGVSRGDVIVAHVIHSFDYGKLVGGTFKRRPENDINCDRSLLAWAEIAAADLRGQDWRHLIREIRPDQGDPAGFKVHVDCYVASSNKVVDDPDHAFYANVASAFPEIHAVEMEGIGAGASARLAQSERAVGFLMIRGISDEPGTSVLAKEQRAQWKRYAVATAAAFTRTLIERLPPKTNHTVPGTKGPSGTPFLLPQTDEPTFTGRLTEIASLEDVLLRQEGERLSSIVGLTGSGGMGKSALACHFAELHQKDFPDGVIGLRVDGKSLESIAREFLLSVGIAVAADDTRSPAALMQDTFRARCMLLIFDNAEDASIRALCPGGRDCSVIITTRNRSLPASLNVSARGAIDVPPLPQEDCASLLRKILDRDQRLEAEPDSAAEIARLVGRLPLAIQIVGASLRMQPWLAVSNYLESLRNEQRRLNVLALSDDAERNVRACLALSLKALDSKPKVVEVFGSLTVCSKEGFSVFAAKNATGLDSLVLDEAIETLHRLCLLNLTAGSQRFVYHPLLWLLARESVAPGVIDESRRRHALGFVGAIKETSGSMLAKEVDELLLAAGWLVDQQIVDYEFLIRLEPVLTEQGAWHAALHLMSRFLLLAERMADADAAIQLRIQQAKYLTLMGNYASAADTLSPVEGLVSNLERSASRDRVEAMYLNSLGGVLHRQGKFDDAEDVFRRSADIEQRLGNQRGQAMVLNSLGGVLQRQGKFDDAVDAFRRSADIEQRLGNQRGQAMVLNSLGGVLQRQGKFDDAADAFRRSYDLLVKLGDERGQAMVLNSLGGVLQRQGKFDDAVGAFRRSSDIEQRLGNKRGQAMVLNSLGGVLQRQGKFDDAVGAFRRSSDIEQRLGNKRGQAMVLNSLGG